MRSLRSRAENANSLQRGLGELRRAACGGHKDLRRACFVPPRSGTRIRSGLHRTVPQDWVAMASTWDEEGHMTTATRLSPLDDSFLGLEEPTAHMHVGWTALFEPPADRPRPELRGAAPPHRHAAGPRPPLPAEDQPGAAGHRRAELDRRSRTSTSPATSAGPASEDLDQAVEHCMSRQLPRERPLWEVRIAEQLERRPHRRDRQGASLHGRRDRRRRAGLAAARPHGGRSSRGGRRLAARPSPRAQSRASSRGLAEKAMGPVRGWRAAPARLLLSPRRLLSAPRDAPGRARCRRPHPAPGDSGGAAEPAALGAAARWPGSSGRSTI